MNTTNIRINPGTSRVDFLKLRKLSSGGHILKASGGATFRSGSSISNMGFANGYDENKFWSIFGPSTVTTWKEYARTHPNASIEDINRFILLNPLLRAQTNYTEGGSAITGSSDIQRYQQDFHNEYKFGEDPDTFFNMFTSLALYGTDNTLSGGSDSSSQTFTGDRAFGSLMYHRLPTYWTEAEAALANQDLQNSNWKGRKWVKDPRPEVVADPRNGVNGRYIYYLSSSTDDNQGNTNLGTSETSEVPKESESLTLTLNDGNADGADIDGGELPELAVIAARPTIASSTSSSQSEGDGFMWTPYIEETFPKREEVPFTQPYINGLMLGTSLANSARLAELAKKKRASLLEGPYLLAKVTNMYGPASAMRRAINESEYKSTQNLGSDLTHNMDARLASAQLALAALAEVDKLRTQEFNETTQNVNTTANTNTQIDVLTANADRQIADVLTNQILNAEAEKAARNATAINDYIDKTSVAAQAHLLDQRLENDAYQQRINNYLYNKDVSEAYAQYRDLCKGIDRDLIAIRAALNDIHNNPNTDGKFTEVLQQITEVLNDNTLSEAQKQQKYIEIIVDWLNQHSDDELGKQYWDMYEKHKEAAKLAGYEFQLRAYELLQRTQISSSVKYSGQGYSSRSSIPAYVSVIPTAVQTMAKGGRFIDYLNNHQKTQEDALKRLLKSTQQAVELLKRDLNSLDRETLMLLRSIFK